MRHAAWAVFLTLALLPSATAGKSEDFQRELARGLVLLEVGEYEKALIAMRRAAALNPDRIDLKLRIAALEARTGQDGLAERRLRELVARDADNTDVLRELGGLLLVRGKHAEAESYLLQVTYGCSHNECTYCAMYRHKTFSARPVEEVLEDVREAGRRFPATRRVFLLDGDAMTLSTAKLVPVMEALAAAFPSLQRVGSYVNAVSVLRKSDDDLRRLRDLKLSIGYLGLETGDPATAERIVKGATVPEQVEAVRRAQAAGIRMSVMVLLGMGGRARSKEHAEATADALTAMDPRYVSCLCVTPVEGTPFYDQVERGEFEMISPGETLDELRTIVDRARLSGAVFRSNHASNYLPLGGRLPADRERLLAAIDAARRGDVPLVPEQFRGL